MQVLPTDQKKLSDKNQHPLINWEKVNSLSFHSTEFWKHVLSWLLDNDIYVRELKEADLFLGKSDVQDDPYQPHSLLGKYYIYSHQCQNAKPSLKGFIAKTKPHMARKREINSFSFRKQEKLVRGIAIE